MSKKPQFINVSFTTKVSHRYFHSPNTVRFTKRLSLAASDHIASQSPSHWAILLRRSIYQRCTVFIAVSVHCPATKPLKDALSRLWNDWLMDGDHTFTAGGRMRQPTLSDISEWILRVWHELDRLSAGKASSTRCSNLKRLFLEREKSYLYN